MSNQSQVTRADQHYEFPQGYQAYQPYQGYQLYYEDGDYDQVVADTTKQLDEIKEKLANCTSKRSKTESWCIKAECDKTINYLHNQFDVLSQKLQSYVKLAEQKRIAEERIAEEKRLIVEEERIAEEKRIEDEKLAEEERIAKEKRIAKEQAKQEKDAKESKEIHYFFTFLSILVIVFGIVVLLFSFYRDIQFSNRYSQSKDELSEFFDNRTIHDIFTGKIDINRIIQSLEKVTEIEKDFQKYRPFRCMYFDKQSQQDCAKDLKSRLIV